VIILDTNVLSALMRREGEGRVVAWLDRQPSESVWTTAISVFEIRFGLKILADGRRRRRLEDSFAEALQNEFGGRILPFDQVAAEAAASIAAQQRRAGKTVEIRDIQIAGITTARRATLATRNVRDFENIGIVLADPWRD
jgi:predicted nucleic acid-binding protein